MNVIPTDFKILLKTHAHARLFKILPGRVWEQRKTNTQRRFSSNSQPKRQLWISTEFPIHNHHCDCIVDIGAVEIQQSLERISKRLLIDLPKKKKKKRWISWFPSSRSFRMSWVPLDRTPRLTFHRSLWYVAFFPSRLTINLEWMAFHRWSLLHDVHSF